MRLLTWRCSANPLKSAAMAPGTIPMRALVDALDEPAFIVEGLTVSFANQAARTLLGQGIEEHDVRLAIRHPDALGQILAGRSGEIELTGIGEVGRPWRLIIRDLGQGASFVRMVDRASAVSAEKIRVDFVANASHELRTPLATVIGYAETLADDDALDEAVRTRFARTIRDEATRMLRLIEDLMSLSRIQADRFVEPAGLVPIERVIRTAVANAARLRNGLGCAFSVEVAPDLPQVRGDEPQLTQVFDNLLSNAVRYGCDGDGDKVEVSASHDVNSVTVVVTDHGPGIARDHIPRLTERFYRVDEARSRGSGGTGLGLAIVKHIVERHRGRLEIKSEIGAGTSVSVQLPISASSAVINA